MGKYKAEISFISLVSVIIILFPPVQEIRYDRGYSFFFTIDSDYSINYGKLFLEFFLLGFLALLLIVLKPSVKILRAKLVKKKKQ